MSRLKTIVSFVVDHISSSLTSSIAVLFFFVHVGIFVTQGLVFILYDSIQAASRGLDALNGRLFSGNTISAEFYALNLYKEKYPDQKQQ